MQVQHFTLTPKQSVVSTYLSTLRVFDPAVQDTVNDDWDHPGEYTVSSPGAALEVELYHGRFNADEDLDDWGFQGPTLNCLTLAHDTEQMLLQGCDSASLELAKRIGLTVTNDTIAVAYEDDLLVVPKFRDGKPAYFGDHSATAKN